MKRTVLLAAVLAAGTVGLATPRQDPPAPVILGPARTLTPAETAAKLTGSWKLNEELSPLPRAGSSPAAGAVPSRGTNRPPGGSGQGGGGFGGGRPAPRATVTQEQQQQLRVRALYRELTVRPVQLTITATETSAKFVDDDGVERAVAINNKKDKLDLGTAIVESRTRWDGTALTIELTAGEDLKLFEIFELSPTGRQLLVTLKTSDSENPRPGRVSGNLHRVYDRIQH